MTGVWISHFRNGCVRLKQVWRISSLLRQWRLLSWGTCNDCHWKSLLESLVAWLNWLVGFLLKISFGSLFRVSPEYNNPHGEEHHEQVVVEEHFDPRWILVSKPGWKQQNSVSVTSLSHIAFNVACSIRTWNGQPERFCLNAPVSCFWLHVKSMEAKIRTLFQIECPKGFIYALSPVI